MTPTRVIVMVGSWVVLVLALAVSDARPAVFALAGLVAALCTVAFVALDLAESIADIEWTRRARRATTATFDPRVSSLKRKVQSTWWSGSTEIGDTLVELVDDRLLTRHHVDRAADPDAAMAVLGPELRSLVADPRRRALSPRELDTLLTEIEAL